ncbi:ATP-binding protein [Variovorax sp. VNK109]|uniref:ATP-binding protein n=1 Tax=Variovorax sp. VNK109 TaxID=3400919 RepID=UPI003C076F78
MPFFPAIRHGLLSMLMTAPLMAGAVMVSPVDGKDDPVELTTQAFLLDGARAQAPVQDVIAGRHDNEFRLLGDGDAARCSRASPCWLRVSMARRADTLPVWVLRLRATETHEVMLYERTAEGVLLPAVAGQQYTLFWRIGSADLIFPIVMHERRSTYYLRVSRPLTDRSLALWQNDGFHQMLQAQLFFLSTSLGLTLVLSMVSMVLWRWLKDKLYLQFSLLTLTGASLHLWQVVQTLTGTHGPPELDLRGAIQALFHAASLRFFPSLFEVRRYSMPLWRFCQIGIALNLVGAGFALTGHYALVQTPLALLMVAIAVTGLCYVWWVSIWRQRDLMIAALCVTAPLLLTFVSRLELFSGPALQDRDALDPLSVAVRITYLLLLSLLIAQRVSKSELEARTARRREREVARRAERDLEAKVAQRTQELAYTNELLHKEVEHRRLAELNLQGALEAERKAVVQQRQFVEMASHEFRTPLAIIDAAAGAMELTTSSAPARTSLGRIRKAVDRLTGLIENFLTEDPSQSRPAAGKGDRFDLRTILQRLTTAFGAQGEQRLRIVLPDMPCPIAGDMPLLEVAVQNLVQNALKYSPADRPVTVTTRVDGASICLDVRDEGRGIGQDERDSIFEKFQRGTTSAGTGGTGLGLYLVRSIARRHGGDVELFATGDTGSVFRLRIPVSGPMADLRGE